MRTANARALRMKVIGDANISGLIFARHRGSLGVGISLPAL